MPRSMRSVARRIEMDLFKGFEAGVGLGCIVGFLIIAGPSFFLLATTPWHKCFFAGSGVSPLHILGMRLRGTPVGIITDAHIALTHRGIHIDAKRVESAFLSEPGRVHTASDLVSLVIWGIEQANPKPLWAIDVQAMTIDRPTIDRAAGADTR